MRSTYATVHRWCSSPVCSVSACGLSVYRAIALLPHRRTQGCRYSAGCGWHSAHMLFQRRLSTARLAVWAIVEQLNWSIGILSVTCKLCNNKYYSVHPTEVVRWTDRCTYYKQHSNINIASNIAINICHRTLYSLSRCEKDRAWIPSPQKSLKWCYRGSNPAGFNCSHWQQLLTTVPHSADRGSLPTV